MLSTVFQRAVPVYVHELPAGRLAVEGAVEEGPGGEGGWVDVLRAEGGGQGFCCWGGGGGEGLGTGFVEGAWGGGLEGLEEFEEFGAVGLVGGF